MAESELAIFLDQNRGLSREIDQINKKQLENTYNTKYQIYNQVLLSLEKAKLEYQENLPVFTVIQEPLVPLYSSSPGKKTILIGATLFGFFLGCSWSVIGFFFKRWLKEIRFK